MRLSLGLSGLCALIFACGAPEAQVTDPAEPAGNEPKTELGVLVQRITGTTAEHFNDTLEAGETAARGPFAVFPGQKLMVSLAGRGDADVYVRFDARPTLETYDCRPYTEHSNETCTLTVPANAKSVYVDVVAETDSSHSLVLESVEVSGGGGGGGNSGNDPFVIAVLGSSTAEGEGASSLSNSWVNLLQAQLSTLADVEIVNFATGGYSTLDLLPHTGDDGTIDDAIAEDPDLVVISLAGSNDISVGTPAASYLPRLSKAAARAKAAGIPTFFVGTAPKNMNDEERSQLGDWNEQMRSRFSSCYSPADPAYSPCFIDVMADLGNTDREIEPQYDSGDGIHINDAGHRVVFEQASEVITQYVCLQTGCR